MIDSESLCIMDTEPILKDCLKDIEDEIYFMQFTGLSDKNGKEIYEGDILWIDIDIKTGYSDGDFTKRIKAVIKFDNGCFWFEGEGHTDCNWHFYNEYMVIGNIYENLELL